MEKTKNQATLAQRLAEFIQKIQVLLIIVVAVLLVGLGVFIGINVAQDASQASAAKSLYAIQQKYEKLSNTADEAAKKTLEAEIQTAIDALGKGKPHDFSTQEAYKQQGDYYSSKGDYKQASAAYAKAANAKKKSYLYPVVLIALAVSYENGGDVDSAIKTFEKLVKENSASAIGLGRVYFNLGRLYESKADYKSAKTNYQTCVDKFSQDPWANLSQSRLIYLKAQNLGV
jgi:tetratricopeptide (TPR) repeat protein